MKASIKRLLNIKRIQKTKKVNKSRHQLGLILLGLLLSIHISIGQNVIDTEKTNMKYYEMGYGLNDCTIRAYKEMMGVKYVEAYKELKKEGKIDGEGMELEPFLLKVQKDGMLLGMTNRITKKANAKILVKYDALNKNQNYLMFCTYTDQWGEEIGHIYFMSYEDYEWNLYGNRGDQNHQIRYIIGVKKLNKDI